MLSALPEGGRGCNGAAYAGRGGDTGFVTAGRLSVISKQVLRQPLLPGGLTTSCLIAECYRFSDLRREAWARCADGDLFAVADTKPFEASQRAAK